MPNLFRDLYERGYQQPINKYSRINPPMLGMNVLASTRGAKTSPHRHTVGHRAAKRLAN